MGSKYLVLGAGRQGVAIAYDLSNFGEAEQVLLADQNAEIAAQRAARINSRNGSGLVRGVSLDVHSVERLMSALEQADVCISAVPYPLNVELTKLAIKAKTHFCDLGGNTDIVRQQLELSEDAKEAGISIVPDCGLAPGMGNSIALYAIQKLDEKGCEPRDIKMYCGGLPRHPIGPLNYQLFFSIGGLINEYDSVVYSLRGGKVEEVEPLTELESLSFPDPVGECEAFLTSGGTSLAPWNYQGKLNSYEYKTVRYPGHCEKMRAMRLLGLWESEERKIGEIRVSPRAVFEAMADEHLRGESAEDIVVLRVVARGMRENSPEVTTIQMDLFDRYDAKTGFTAMERTTGFSTAIVAKMQATGQIEPGANTPDPAVPAKEFVEALRERGFSLSETDNGKQKAR